MESSRGTRNITRRGRPGADRWNEPACLGSRAVPGRPGADGRPLRARAAGPSQGGSGSCSAGGEVAAGRDVHGRRGSAAEPDPGAESRVDAVEHVVVRPVEVEAGDAGDDLADPPPVAVGDRCVEAPRARDRLRPPRPAGRPGRRWTWTPRAPGTSPAGRAPWRGRRGGAAASARSGPLPPRGLGGGWRGRRRSSRARLRWSRRPPRALAMCSTPAAARNSVTGQHPTGEGRPSRFTKRAPASSKEL
jgi:hypothetical protein